MNATQSDKILVSGQFFVKVPSSGKHPYLPAFVHGYESILISRGQERFLSAPARTLWLLLLQKYANKRC